MYVYQLPMGLLLLGISHNSQLTPISKLYLDGQPSARARFSRCPSSTKIKNTPCIRERERQRFTFSNITLSLISSSPNMKAAAFFGLLLLSTASTSAFRDLDDIAQSVLHSEDCLAVSDLSHATADTYGSCRHLAEKYKCRGVRKNSNLTSEDNGIDYGKEITKAFIRLQHPEAAKCPELKPSVDVTKVPKDQVCSVVEQAQLRLAVKACSEERVESSRWILLHNDTLMTLSNETACDFIEDFIVKCLDHQLNK